jgi:hypothetical protein
VSFLRQIRASYTKFFWPKSKYPLFPISTKFGFDRGTPIDRFYIEHFLASNATYIHGSCLEIENNNYTTHFGASQVTKSDVLDVNEKNGGATIHGDLRKLNHILTHTLGVIDDHESAVRETLRILKPGGTLLVTVSSMGVMQNPENCYWRYTPASLKYLLGKYVPDKNISVGSYGNVCAGQAFWVGIAKEELSHEELMFNDPRYAVIATAVVKK